MAVEPDLLLERSPVEIDAEEVMSQAAKTKNLNETKGRLSKEAFLIESLKIVVNGIARTFGPRCEVVLHDLRNFRNLDHSIVKIENGHVTGRTVGGPISDRGLKDLKIGRNNSLFINYPSVTNDGRRLKSSTMLFRDDKKKLIAGLCINFDVTDILNLNAVVQDLFAVSEETKGGEALETLEGNITSTLNGMTAKVIRKTGKITSSMHRNDKIDIVRQLDRQGFFLIKGATKLLASKLHISKFTIYNYLEQIRSES